MDASFKTPRLRGLPLLSALGAPSLVFDADPDIDAPSFLNPRKG